MTENIDAERAALLPCPFCGSSNIAHETFDEDESRDFVMCNGCGVYAQRNDCDAEPVEVWSRRTPSASIGEDGLPELPEPEVAYEDGKDQWGYADYGHAYSADQMRQYARLAVTIALSATHKEG